MTDRELQHLLPDYINGRLDEATCREIELRLEQSADLRRALEAAKLYTDAVGAIEPVRAREDFLQKVHHRIQEKRGLLDRLFNPLHIKLPIELAGVAVTVLLVILLYNPFSGRLPPQIVERKAQQYMETAESPPPPPATGSVVPGSKESVPSEAASDLAPTDAAEKKMALRQAPRSTALKSESRKLRKQAAEPFESETATPAPKASYPAKPVQPTDRQALARRPAPIRSSLRMETEKDKESAFAQTEPDVPAMSAPPPSPPQSPRMETRSEAAAGAIASRYDVAEAEEAAAYDEENSVRSVAKKSLERLAARKRQRVASTEQQAHAPAASASMEIRDAIDPFEITARITRRHGGAIDSVLVRSPALLSIRVTIPAQRFGAYKNALSEELEGVFITYSSIISRGKDLSVTLEVHGK